MNQQNVSCRIDVLSPQGNGQRSLDVLRLDLLHPIVSGNKWFKLKNYLAEAEQKGQTVLTFGGAFSNHIVAAAAATHGRGLKSIGVIRGEKLKTVSLTLQQAEAFGMQLFFASREEYKNKHIPAGVFNTVANKSLCIIPEGGYGSKGMEGAKDILFCNDTSPYTHILCAAGTGTTLAGLIAASRSHQKVIGISAMKNNRSLEEEIKNLLPPEKKDDVTLLHDYHFGGYAKHTSELMQFMNDFYLRTNIPTDFVYTGKAFFAAFDLLRKQYFSPNDKLLLVHTGGLQGNRSLPKGTLIFD